MPSIELEQFVDLSRASIEKNNFAELLQLLLTMDEQEQLKLRISLLAQLLVGDKSQREIAKNLNISISKITRGSNELKRTPEPMKAFLKEYFSKIKND